MVPFLVPIGVHRRQKERHDRDGRRAVRVVVKVRDGPRRRAGLDAVLHPEGHQSVRANRFQFAANNPDAREEPPTPVAEDSAEHGAVEFRVGAFRDASEGEGAIFGGEEDGAVAFRRVGEAHVAIDADLRRAV